MFERYLGWVDGGGTFTSLEVVLIVAAPWVIAGLLLFVFTPRDNGKR